MEEPGAIKGKKTEKGIEKMFRIVTGNNQRLSAMADNKAHILISVNSILLSAVIGLLFRKLDEYTYLQIPTYVLLTVSVVTIVFSILATRPKLPSGKFTKEDLHERKTNLLFFGNFYKMPLTDYIQGMELIMEERDILYHSLLKYIYSQGLVLARKYSLLRIAYNIFMFGIIISVLCFIVANIMKSKNIV